MTTRYCGPGGNDAWAGTSWATRKLTLNGLEDSPVTAGDVCYIAPGTYRETLTCDVSGGAGSPITYIGDYDGSHTDGVGGVARITGSDDDQVAVRANCIAANAKNYRTFSGLAMDTATGNVLAVVGGTDWVIQQCIVFGIANGLAFGTTTPLTIQNCFVRATYAGINVDGLADATTDVISNCVILAGAVNNYQGIHSRHGGMVIRNCTILSANRGLSADTNVGQTVTVNNCVVAFCSTGLWAAALGEMTEDYNTVYGCVTARSNVAVGANSLAYPPLFDSRWFFELVNGGRMLSPFDLASYSQLVDVAGTSPTTTDMRGTAAIGGVREWGSLEFDPTLLIESAAGGGGAVSISPLKGNIG